MNTKQYLELIGITDRLPTTYPFDPGYDPETFKAHLRQSSHLMAGIKISMACWQIANEEVTREKLSACRSFGVKASAGGGPLEVAAQFNVLSEYFDLCADLGFDRIEAGQGFTKTVLNERELVKLAASRGLEVQFELGEKHSGEFDDKELDKLLRVGNRWLEAGAKQLVIEARENALGVGLFDGRGNLNTSYADKLINEFGAAQTIFEAPIKSSQFALLNHLGPEVRLGNVRLEELLRVEIYRKGLHSDAFSHANLAPTGPNRSNGLSAGTSA